MTGRIALVSGSYRGTGAGIARVLAREGARVWVHGFEAEAAERVAAGIREQGGNATAVAGDIRNDEGADAIADAVGPIDLLINNYGVAEGGSWKSEMADWIDQYQKNVLTGVRLVQRLTPGMRERGFGRVIFVGTVGTLRPAARMPHYYAAKAALPSLTLSLAKELSGSGVTVNLVSPGIVATAEVLERFEAIAKKRGLPTDRSSVEELILEKFMPNPTGRVGEPEDVGSLVAFLCSEHAGYINAANIPIDGGAADAVRI
ncbi:MAG: SDR family oxidoreductase [Deltaproteobacteria bacterium]|nr:SDR family oxidoreductase [Deltaproteobacteria bacterium]